MTAEDKTAVPLISEAERQLEQSAHRLATHHTLLDQPAIVPDAPGANLRWLGQRLEAIHLFYTQTTEQELALSYAAEWLLDNFYFIQQALRQVQQDLPPTYYRQLPCLPHSEALSGSIPRVYMLARAFSEHEECQHNLTRLKRFITAYQQNHPLTMGEVWALPIMLRLTLLECLTLALGRLTHSLDLPDPEQSTAVQILDYHHTIHDNDIVAHTIASLRQINGEDWERFFEEISLVEHKLRQEPAGIYGRMDFDSRDQYRKVIETIAQNSTYDEISVTHTALHLAQQQHNEHEVAAGEKPRQDSLAHIGYYLMSDGRSQLEAALHYQPTSKEKARRILHAHPTLFYLGSTTLLTALFLGAVGWYAAATGGSLEMVLFTLFLTLIPALTIADSVVNWIVTHTIAPRILLKLDFEKGVPDDHRTIVVIPALLAQTADVDSLFTQLEMHYRRNPDPNLAYALLTDFADAPKKDRPEDEALLQEAQTRLQALNETYSQQPFYFFHRHADSG